MDEGRAAHLIGASPPLILMVGKIFVLEYRRTYLNVIEGVPELMPQMSLDEMKALAEKIARMRFNRAKGYIRGLDKHGRLELFRVAVGTGEWYTRFALPTRGLLITLVEVKEEYGAPNEMGYRRTRFKFIEARVEALPTNHYNDNEGSNAQRADMNMESGLTTPR